MPGSASVDGLASGLNTTDIITKMMSIEQQPITKLQSQQATLATKLAAWQDANTRILALKDKANALADPSTFEGKTFSSGDETLIKGAASPTAQSGTYYVKVNSLARAEQDKTQGYADTDTTRVGVGTISISVGSASAQPIAIDAGCNTLSGLRDAINQAKIGVTATIVDDGSGINPYHLVLTGNTTGTAGQLTVDTSGLSGGTAPTFTVMQSAQSASVTLGEGVGAITVTRNSNEIKDLISGVTLDLQSSDTSKTAMLVVQNDTTGTKKAIQDFADQYNNLMDFIGQQFAYDPASNVSGPLFSDSSLQMIQSDLTGKVASIVGDSTASIRTLSKLGITFSSHSDMVVDQGALDNALSTDPDGVKALFATTGQGTNANATFIAAGAKTQSSGTAGYAVDITSVATQSALTSGATQTSDLTQDETLTINSKTVKLTNGMTPDQVIAEINKHISETGVTASRVGGALTLTSVQYGPNHVITASSTVASGGSGVGDSGAAFASGTNVVGTINGEVATGNGQILTGNVGNKHTDGLTMRITAATPGSYGTVAVAKGIGSQLSDYLTFITDPSSGSVNTAESAIQGNIDRISKDVTDMQSGLSAKQDQLTQKFADMEAALSKLQDEGSYLASQFNQAAANSAAIKK
jgi:flagellar hook-associated protein 2